MRKIDALLRFHYKVDPAELSDKEWANMWQDLKWVLNFENERMSKSMGGGSSNTSQGKGRTGRKK